jgi:drug/metabolite transporter (DMT)-like permease
MALLYAIPSLFIVQFIPPTFDVNPSPGTWVFVLLMNVFHVSALVTYAYRWMCIEDEVPEASAGRSRARRR